MLQTKVVEKIKTHFVFSNFFFLENCAVNEIMWKNTVGPVRPQVTIWRMRIPYWIREATDAYSECMIGLCIAFPLRQWLHDRASTYFIREVQCLSLYC